MSRTGVVFPGQGSQFPGMGRALADRFPESRDVFARADAALGMRLSQICFEGDEAALRRTEITQPAVLAVSLAAWAALRRRGFGADAAAGHSLGEYTALVAAESLALEDAVRAVHARGRFMQEAVPEGEGAMAAILGLEREEVERICGEASRSGQLVCPANMNGPGQVVVAGHAGAVERATALARKAGARRVVPLPVSAPFHCPLMEPAARRLAEVLAAIPFRDPRIPVYTTVDGSAVRDASTARAMLLRQVTAPVEWERVVRTMVAEGVARMVEVGPGRVLCGLVRRIAPEVVVAHVGEPEEVEALAGQEPGWA